jgi:hypothetical protein
VSAPTLFLKPLFEIAIRGGSLGVVVKPVPPLKPQPN